MGVCWALLDQARLDSCLVTVPSLQWPCVLRDATRLLCWWCHVIDRRKGKTHATSKHMPAPSQFFSGLEMLAPDTTEKPAVGDTGMASSNICAS